MIQLDPRVEEAADILAGLAEQAHAAGETNFAEAQQDDLPFDLLDEVADEGYPRAERLRNLMRERGWSGWNHRMERLAEPPDPWRRYPPESPLDACHTDDATRTQPHPPAPPAR
jgi:hypothetical protein